MAAFTKYLPRFGWDPVVITGPWNPDRSLHDPATAAKIPDGVTVHRTGHTSSKGVRRFFRRLGLLRLFEAVTPSFPMMEGGWIPHGYRKGLRVLEEGGFDLIYSSGYPIASHVVAYLLKRRTGLPWVADYRDEWSIRSILSWPTPLHRRLARRIDARLIRAADAVVTTSPVHTETFTRAFPPEGRQRFLTITNGYDEEDFLGPVPPLAVPPREDRLTLAHVGTVNASRDGDGLLQAVRQLIRSGRVPASEIELLFAGQVHGLSDPWLEEQDVLRIVDYLPHPEAVGTMRASDVLLLLNTERENILGKTFEYLASGRPVLGILTEGATADLVRESSAGPVVDPADVEGIAGQVAEAHERWRSRGLRGEADPGVVRRYSRRETTKALSELFHGLSRDDHPLASRSRLPDPVSSTQDSVNHSSPEGA